MDSNANSQRATKRKQATNDRNFRSFVSGERAQEEQLKIPWNPRLL